jgi:WD40 repeat protein
MTPFHRIVAWTLGLALLADPARAADAALQDDSLPAGAVARLGTLRPRGSSVLSIAFAPDGKTLAAGSGDGKVRLWDVATGKELRILTGRGKESRVVAMAFSPDGKTLASSSEEITLVLWDPQTGKEKHRHEKNFANLEVTHLRFSPDGKSVAAHCVFG